TEEHLQILNYLGVTRAVVALTKIDLTQDEPGAIAKIREKLRGTPFADAPIVPTSVVTGRGLDDLKTALARLRRRASAGRHRQTVAAGRSRIQIARHRYSGYGHADWWHVAPRPNRR